MKRKLRWKRKIKKGNKRLVTKLKSLKSTVYSLLHNILSLFSRVFGDDYETINPEVCKECCGITCSSNKLRVAFHPAQVEQ